MCVHVEVSEDGLYETLNRSVVRFKLKQLDDCTNHENEGDRQAVRQRNTLTLKIERDENKEPE